MNMHIPQSLQTQTELEKISLVHENLISPGNSKPSIEIVQDTLVGSYLLTIKDNKLNENQIYNYMMFNKKFNGKLPYLFLSDSEIVLSFSTLSISDISL